MRAGFREEGITRGYGLYERFEPLRGARFDMVLYGRLTTDQLPPPSAPG